MKHFWKILLPLVLVILFPLQTFAAVNAAGGISVDVLDTVADFPTRVQVEGAAPHSALALFVENPAGSVFQISVPADEHGNGSREIPSENIRKSGTYFVRQDDSSVRSTFQVFPGEMSPEKSRILADRTNVSANGVDFATVEVRIQDEYENPLPFHEVRFVSSRGGDQITARSNETDEHGQISFVVSSSEPGTAYLTATDETVAEVLPERLAIRFGYDRFGYARMAQANSIGGDPILLAQAVSL